jgi:peptidoglycan-N-acetylglucosamine deacetylase
MSWPAYITIWTAGLIGTILALVEDAGARIWLVLALLGVYLLVMLAGALFPQLGLYFSVAKRGSHEQGRVALTFENGPDPRLTPRLLDLLKRERIPAMFFAIGAEAENQPDLVRRMDEEGHLLGNHTYAHRWRVGWLTRSGLRSELEKGAAALIAVIRRRPRFVRLPQGLAHPGLRRVLRELNLTGVGWDVRAGTAADPQRAAAHCARLARNGSIIALPGDTRHAAATPEAVLETARQIITLLKERGFAFVRLDQLLGLAGDEPA